MSDKLKVGIVGMGTIGPVHADAYVNSGEAEIVGICDLLPQKLELHGNKLGVKNRYKDYRQLLAGDAQAISVCVPNAMHKEIAIAALQAGKHVLLEKPMALNSTQAADICTAGRKAKGILQIGMVNRQKPDAQVLRQCIKDGMLGDIYHIRAVLIRRRGIPGMGGWFTTKAKSGGGPMIDLGVHWFDLSMWLSDLWKPTLVSARTYAKFGNDMKNYKYVSMWAGPPNYKGKFDVEDYSTGFVRFGNKATMSFEISWAANAQDESFVEVLGDKGGARLFGEKPLTILTEHGGQLVDIAPQYNSKVNAFHAQAKKFISACRGEIEPVATGQQGQTISRLLDAIYASSTQGKEVKF
jgi:predicted dehydrogenase